MKKLPKYCLAFAGVLISVFVFYIIFINPVSIKRIYYHNYFQNLTRKEIENLCSKYGTFSSSVPKSAHLVIQYYVSANECYGKEPYLGPDVYNITIQKIEDNNFFPILRVTNLSDRDAAENWMSFKAAIKTMYGVNYQEINVNQTPFFSDKLKKAIGDNKVIRITEDESLRDKETAYYFTDGEGMYSLWIYEFANQNDRSRVIIDYN